MKTVEAFAPAKINLNLRILGLRKDGYHELRTLFYPVTSLYDTIRIEPSHDENMFMRCPENEDLECATNLIYKAWKAYGAANSAEGTLRGKRNMSSIRTQTPGSAPGRRHAPDFHLSGVPGAQTVAN